MDNNIGVVGVAPDVQIYMVKVLNDNGFAFGTDVAAATQLCTDAGADIICMSLGGSGHDATEQAIFQQLYDRVACSLMRC